MMLSVPAYQSRTYFVSGAVFLLIGISVYVFDRPPGNILFLTDYVTAIDEGMAFYGSVGEFLPSLCHVIGFSLVTFSLYPVRSIGIIAPLFWGAFNLIFEIAQLLLPVSSSYNDYVEGSYAFSVNTLHAFISYGTFDLLDVGAIFAGAIACIFLLQHKTNWRLK